MANLLQRASHWLARLSLILSKACLIALMGLTVVEVIGRYLFNAPIFGRQDIAQILLASSIFFAFPIVTLKGDQIAVDLLDRMFSSAGGFWRDRMIEALTSSALIVMGYWLFDRAEKAFSRGIKSELLFLPKYPLITLIAAIVCLTGILLALRCALAAIKGRRKGVS